MKQCWILVQRKGLDPNYWNNSDIHTSKLKQVYPFGAKNMVVARRSAMLFYYWRQLLHLLVT